MDLETKGLEGIKGGYGERNYEQALLPPNHRHSPSWFYSSTPLQILKPAATRANFVKWVGRFIIVFVQSVVTTRIGDHAVSRQWTKNIRRAEKHFYPIKVGAVMAEYGFYLRPQFVG